MKWTCFLLFMLTNFFLENLCISFFRTMEKLWELVQINKKKVKMNKKIKCKWTLIFLDCLGHSARPRIFVIFNYFLFMRCFIWTILCSLELFHVHLNNFFVILKFLYSFELFLMFIWSILNVHLRNFFVCLNYTFNCLTFMKSLNFKNYCMLIKRV